MRNSLARLIQREVLAKNGVNIRSLGVLKTPAAWIDFHVADRKVLIDIWKKDTVRSEADVDELVYSVIKS